MKKLILILIKIIPLVTIYHGLSKGGVKFRPMVNIGKVIFTQYEIKKITSLVIQDYKDSKGRITQNNELSKLINDHLTGEYSVLIRQMLGHEERFDVDIWGMSYKVSFDEKTRDVSIYSAGPDKKYETKDDVKLSFHIQGTGDVSRAATQTSLVDEQEIESEDSGDYDEYGYDQEGYDQEGFDEYGFDRDGFNKDGYDEEGFDRDGYDQYGYDRQGLNQDGLTFEESQSN